MRRNFDEVLLSAKVNIRKEYSRLYHLFYVELVFGMIPRKSLSEIINEHFIHLQIRGTCMDLADFNAEYHFEFKAMPGNFDEDYLINFCEYCYNLCLGYLGYEMSNIYPGRNECEIIIKQVGTIIEKIGYQEIRRNSSVIFVPKDSAAISASEIVDEELAPKLLEYNHHSLKGDLSGKREILRKMSNYIEPKYEDLNNIDSSLKNDLSFILNRFDIRHNNKDGNKCHNPILVDVTDGDLETIYDDAYQMWLLAILQLDNTERKIRVEELRNRMKK